MRKTALNPASLRAGRTDPVARLADRLSSADASYLEGALDNPRFDEERAIVLLRNRRAAPETLRRLHEDGRFRRSLAVRVGLVCHPSTPRALALNLVPYLPWRELARVADQALVPAPVKRSALRTLETRLDDLALGELSFLARAGGRGVIGLLARRPELPVVREVLRNPRLTEDDVVAICGHRRTPPEVLGLVAQDRRWTRRYGVRLALVHHDRSPLAVILGLLTGLLSRDLEEIRTRPDRPPVVRIAARRILARRYRSGRVRPQPDVYVLEGDETEPDPPA